MPVSDFLFDLKIMYPHQIKSYFVGKIILKQVFNDLFSDLLAKCWRSKNNFYPTILALTAAGFQA